MSANFTPTLNGYTGQQPFRYWCQTALPLIYDDSLSYYELLNKMVVYLNNVISDVGNMESNVNALLSAYNQLQDYVNTYFDNLNVQEEINNKLDEMAEGGTLSTLIAPFVADGLPSVVGDQIDSVVASQIDESVGSQIDASVASQIATPVATNVTSWLNENVTPTGSAVMVDESLSISGAAADAKVTGDKITNLNSAVKYINMSSGYIVTNGDIGDVVTLTPVTNNDYRYAIVDCNPGDYFTINATGANLPRTWAFIDVNNKILQNENSYVNATNKSIIAPANATKLIINDASGRTSFACENTFNLRNNAIDGIYSAMETKNTEIYNGVEPYTLAFETGWINSSGVYISTKNAFITNGISTSNLVNLTNNSTATIYVVYFSAFTSFESFTFATYDSIMPDETKDINHTYPYVAVESTARNNVDLGGILLRQKSIIDYLSHTKINKLNELIGNIPNKDTDKKCVANKATKSFVFFSDVHGGSTNFEHIIDFAETNNIDAILNGGDTVRAYLNEPAQSLQWYTDGISSSSVDILSAIGNHDAWDGATWTKASDTDIYNAIVAPIVAKYSDIQQPAGAETNGLCYYYKDYGAIRVIVINAMSGHVSVEFWDSAQATWLTNVLDDAKTNSKHVIIVNHAPYFKNIAVRDEKLNWNTWLDFKTWPSYDSISFTSGALDVIQNFVTSGGILICLLTGHLHMDNLMTATGYTGQFMINIASAKYTNHPDGYTESDESKPFYDCFDILGVDTTNQLLKILRIGWNEDAAMKIRERMCFNYSSKEIIAH